MGFDCFRGRERSKWGLTGGETRKQWVRVDGRTRKKWVGFDCFKGRERRGGDLTGGETRKQWTRVQKRVGWGLTCGETWKAMGGFDWWKDEKEENGIWLVEGLESRGWGLTVEKTRKRWEG